MLYIPNFLDEENEKKLISQIDGNDWCNDLKRRTQHYGFKYDYSKKRIDESMYLGPIPEWLFVYCDNVFKYGFLKIPDQVIINEYLPGQGIFKHVDCFNCFGDTIASLSLGSTCAMEFEHTISGKKGGAILAPRSLLVLSNEARYDWMHSIPARTEDSFNGELLKRTRRISLTFRTIIKN